jgi:hypothetical protein
VQEELRFLEKLRRRQCRSRIHSCHINLSSSMTADDPATEVIFPFFGLFRDINDRTLWKQVFWGIEKIRACRYRTCPLIPACVRSQITCD